MSCLSFEKQKMRDRHERRVYSVDAFLNSLRCLQNAPSELDSAFLLAVHPRNAGISNHGGSEAILSASESTSLIPALFLL